MAVQSNTSQPEVTGAEATVLPRNVPGYRLCRGLVMVIYWVTNDAMAARWFTRLISNVPGYRLCRGLVMVIYWVTNDAMAARWFTRLIR
ncbi:hypothetical protein H920_10132 [Fukomys damarensis]|uniref:Uncharacterized protein n=1 Tax=Fukomys damarensis TaxID=885580 RepID=A0A091DZP2_FUKDA|nr:hypothetical protein H920_10132 [Fukomys damarensis]